MQMTVILCNKCKSLLMSKYSGEFVSCVCEGKDGKFLDQTEHYGRIGGDPNGMQTFTIDVDWTKTDKPFARKFDDFPYLAAELMLRDAFRPAKFKSSNKKAKSKKPKKGK